MIFLCENFKCCVCQRDSVPLGYPCFTPMFIVQLIKNKGLRMVCSFSSDIRWKSSVYFWLIGNFPMFFFFLPNLLSTVLVLSIYLWNVWLIALLCGVAGDRIQALLGLSNLWSHSFFLVINCQVPFWCKFS